MLQRFGDIVHRRQVELLKLKSYFLITNIERNILNIISMALKVSLISWPTPTDLFTKKKNWFPNYSCIISLQNSKGQYHTYVWRNQLCDLRAIPEVHNKGWDVYSLFSMHIHCKHLWKQEYSDSPTEIFRDFFPICNSLITQTKDNSANNVIPIHNMKRVKCVFTENH